MDFSELISALFKINEGLREQSFRAVNLSLTLRNWFFGFYMVEFEQNGSDRAGYGNALLANISAEMKRQGIPNSDERELRRYRQFYLVYPAAGLLTSTPIRGSSTPVFHVPDIHYIRIFNRLSYTHFADLVRIKDPLKRLFYELECAKGGWSIKELRRQMDSLLFERTGLSKDKERLLRTANSETQANSFPDLIRDPYIFEFIGLKQQEVLPEKGLEQALLDHLLQFLLEMGKGFCFEARQRRIVVDNEHHFVDLVLYHRLLHCNVLIEVKTERFHHSHAEQLNMYLEYYKKYEMTAGDNPPVGILLCTDKEQEHVEFATAGLDDKVFVSKYLIELPDKKELEQFIKRQLQNNLQN
ncbi:PDDEXK nuclease domain-containing protein [Puia dinghuensis]|nr:PDDEXK nuclease domain-containing protein [Puia dinghuensis]